MAIIAKNRNVVNCLINKCGCDQLCKINGQKIMRLLFDNWNEEVAKCLISDGGCQVTVAGSTLLHKLVTEGLIERAVFLVAKCNCNPNLPDTNGNTILHVFCQSLRSHVSITKKPFKDYDTYEEYDSYEEYHTLEQLILKYKCDPNIENKKNETVLHIICYSLLQNGYTFARYRILFFLLRYCKMSPHIKLNNTDKTVLHIVCEVICKGYHDPSILYSLIVEQKCDPSKLDRHGHTAIDMAIKAKNSALVRYLIMCGCDQLSMKNSQKIMKLLFDNWNDEVAKCLICDGGYQVTMWNGTTLLHELVTKKLFDRIVFLVVQCNCNPTQRDKNGNTMVHVFCQFMITQNAFTQEYYDALKLLINKCMCKPNIENNKGDTVLHFVCNSLLSNGYNEDKCRMLFFFLRDCNMSHNIKLVNTDDESVLHIACKAICIGYHDPKILHSLIVKHGCNPSKANRHGHTVLDVAIIGKSGSVVNYLVNECRCDQLCKTMGKKIMKLLFDNWNDEVAKCLICDGGCQVTMENGTTLLHELVAKGLTEKVVFLVKKCSCTCVQTNVDGHTILDVAIIAKNGSVVNCLVKRCGCDELCKTNGQKIMKLLFDNWNDEVAKCLICDGGCQVTMENGTTLLHELVAKGLIERVAFLVKQCKCNPNLLDINGNTLLCQSMKLQNEFTQEHFKQLINECKCDPTIVNRHGETVLHFVCYSLLSKGYNERRCRLLFFLLSDCKMSPHIKLNNTDKTVLHIVCKAICNGYHDLSILRSLILDHKCDPHVDKDIVLCALLQSVITWGNCSIKILYHLLVKLKIDPHITLDNGKSVCLMCYPISDRYLNKWASTGETVSCVVCKSNHSYSCLTYELDRGDSFLMAICNRISKYSMSSGHSEDGAAFKLLCHFFAFIQCGKCDFYKTLKKHKEIINNICSYCLSRDGLDDSECSLTTLDCLIRKHNCMNFLNDKFIAEFFNTRGEAYKKIQHYLIKKDSFKMAKCICLHYSSGDIDLFKSMVETNELDLKRCDNSGDTILHFACQYFRGDTTLIAYIISTGKADPLCYNESSETPMMLLAKSSRSVNAEESVREMIHHFREIKVTHPIESYVKLVFLGNGRVGKSTLIKAMCDRSSYHYVLDIVIEKINFHKNVTAVDLLTAGIITRILNDKDLGRIILHDLAGQPEYYTSHTAVLENLLEGSAAIFILVVSLADANLEQSFKFWLTVIENVCAKSLQQCYTFVVASRADEFKNSDICDKTESLKKLQHKLSLQHKSSSQVEKIIPLDCRKLGGSQLSLLISSLSESCKSVIKENVNNNIMSIYCHLLYDFFQRDEKPVYRLGSLVETFIDQSDLFLPTNLDSLLDVIRILKTTGLILFLRNEINPEKSWIIIDKAILLSALDGVLFAPDYFEEHVSISSNTGIIKLSDLSALFPKYDSELLVQFLQYMELCQIITEEFIISMGIRSLSDGNTDNDQYIFVPALIKDTKKPEIEESFTCGWCLCCTNSHQFFLSRFLHLVLLHLAFKFSVHQSTSSKFKRLCEVWTTGIYWNDTKGVQTLVELVDNNRSLVLLMKCKETANNEIIKLIKDVIFEILTCKEQIMHKTKCDEFVIDCRQLQYPIETESFNSRLYNIEQLARYCINGDHSGYILNNAGGRDSINPSELFEGASLDSFCEAVFVGRKPEVCQ